MEKFRSGSQGGKFGEVFTKTAVNVITSASGQHTFSDEEKASATDHINSVLKADKDLKHLNLPLNPDSMDLFNAVKDGILLW